MEREQDIILKNIHQSIDELTEWQENQYNPGYYMDGRVPANLLPSRKPKVLGWGIIVVALSMTVPIFWIALGFINDGMAHHFIDWALFLVRMGLLTGFAALLLIGGIQKIRKKSE